jgi:hypothetical protein
LEEDNVMMTNRMRTMVQTIEQLPAETQDELAEHIATTLDEAKWQTLLRDPERLERLRALADEAVLDDVKPFPYPNDPGPGE